LGGAQVYHPFTISLNPAGRHASVAYGFSMPSCSNAYQAGKDACFVRTDWIQPTPRLMIF
jgi:hypothetical protein